MTVAEALRAASLRLAATGDTARLDAELLMAHALGVSRSDMLLHHGSAEVPRGFDAMLERRSACEPVAYITGETEFYGRPFAVAPGVLIPRGDSETVVEAALDCAPEPGRVLDLGTGSGCLLLTVLAERPAAGGVGVDALPDAIQLAERNSEALGLADRASLELRDWSQRRWSEGLGTFDLVIANPPYVEVDAALDRQVRDHEPGTALFAGPEGLDDYRLLLPQLGGLLSESGVAVFEIGAGQADAVGALARAQGLAATLRRDLAGRPRALILRRAAG